MICLQYSNLGQANIGHKSFFHLLTLCGFSIARQSIEYHLKNSMVVSDISDDVDIRTESAWLSEDEELVLAGFLLDQIGKGIPLSFLQVEKFFTEKLRRSPWSQTTFNLWMNKHRFSWRLPRKNSPSFKSGKIDHDSNANSYRLFINLLHSSLANETLIASGDFTTTKLPFKYTTVISLRGG